MKEKQLEQEYRNLKRQQTPDLWNRIEENLQEHPERYAKEKEDEGGSWKKANKKRLRWSDHRVYAIATAAAAALVLLVVAPGLMEEKFSLSGSMADRRTAGDRAAVTARMQETEAVQENAAVQETEAVQENAAVQGTAAENRDAGEREPKSSASLKVQAAGGNLAVPESLAGEKPAGVLTWDQLQLAADQPVPVPPDARITPEDSQYFSEDILKDTELLCSGEVTRVSLEEDEAGKAVKVVYDMTLDSIYFSREDPGEADRIRVKSPIVETEGDEAYILYQLQPGGTYLLPLHKPDQDWELLYPFAPQIQVTDEGEYLFHTGYTSLMNGDTSVVIGRPQGGNDYFYDRLVLRKDEDFLSDLLTLIED